MTLILDKLPSARDPWVILEQMPGMVMDRQNVGGSESGQQSSFIAHGSGINQQWNVNGATVTDMQAGGSPMYFDFDSIEAAFKQTSPGHLIQGTHQWIASDRLFFEGKYTYSQNHFVLDFTSPELEDVQGALELSTNVSYRSGNRQDNDPDLGNDITDEELVTLEHELRPNFSVSATYIYKVVHDQQSTFNQGVSSGDYLPVQFTLPCGNASCDAPGYTATYFRLPYQLPTPLLLRNYDFVRKYHGVEFVARRRFSNRWMMQGSFAYNDTRIHYENDLAFQDPTNVALRDGEQTGTLNTRWVAKLSGAYDLPWGVTVAGFFNARDGVPFVRNLLAEGRGNGLADVEVQLDPWGDSRYENFYQVDLRASKTFNLRASHRLSLYADIFNLMNANTVLTRQDQQQLLTANDVLEILAPRVMRVGVKYAF